MPLQQIEDHFSTQATRFFMKIVGMWYPEKPIDTIISNGVLSVFVVAMSVGLINEAIEGFLSWGDLRVSWLW